jgi:hypothetical protein
VRDKSTWIVLGELLGGSGGLDAVDPAVLVRLKLDATYVVSAVGRTSLAPHASLGSTSVPSIAAPPHML